MVILMFMLLLILQGFMNMMTQEVNPDLEILTQLPTRSCTKDGSKRCCNYNHDEDIQLCVSWMNVSNDLIDGNNQAGKIYWTRIVDHYNEIKTSGTERTASSVEHRWGAIQKERMRFQCYYEEVQRRHRSGIPFQEHVC
jgi:hypothetical protein